jgi:hypothetical protein
VHIFWQKRIVEGDTDTKWWYPSQTNQGAIREDRLVLPIPPGVRWDDVMPVVLPGQQKSEVRSQKSEGRKALAEPRAKREPAESRFKAKIGVGFFKFVGEEKATREKAAQSKAAQSKRPKRVKQKNDPQHIAAARELRDRWMEEVNSGRFLPADSGKYEVSRALPERASAEKSQPTRRALIPPPLLVPAVAA